MKEKSLKWLKFAKDDFEVAQAILTTFEDKYAGIVAYHLRQAAEKSFKALLVFNGQLIPRSHNLNVLVEQCDMLDSDFKNMRSQADRLNPFSVQTRYPDDLCADLTFQEVQSLLHDSQQIIEFIEYKII